MSGLKNRNGLAIMIFLSTTIGSIAMKESWAGPSGTTLSGNKTANATVTLTDTYTWTLQKITPQPSTYMIGLGTSQNIPFTITAMRNGPTTTSSMGPPMGQICLTNTGSVPTQGLFLTDQLEQNQSGNWVVIAGPQIIPISAELSAGQTQCYPYQFTGVSLDSLLEYRNHAVAAIDNYLGHEGSSFDIEVFAPVTFQVAHKPIDATATLADTIACPSGFTCSPSSSSQLVSSSVLLPYPITISNNSVCCGQTLSANNQATLTPNQTGILQSASAGIQIFTGTCPPCGSGTEFSINDVLDSNMIIAPGQTVLGGYNFKIPGSHPTTDLILLNGKITIHVTCPDTTIQNIVIPLGLQTYTDPAGSSAWLPTDSQTDPAGFQGSAPVPSTLCGGVSGIASTGATFSGVFSSIPEGQCPNVRFHYQPAPIGSGMHWSSTNVRVCGVCGPVCAPVSDIQLLRHQLETELGISLK